MIIIIANEKNRGQCSATLHFTTRSIEKNNHTTISSNSIKFTMFMGIDPLK